MDYGDDPLVSTAYATHNAAAAHMLQPGNAAALTNLRNRRAWCKYTVAELRDQLITPSMLVAAGLKWRALVKAHGVDALIQYGFRWHDLLACGFTAQHLSSLTREQLARLGINATRALECRPGIREISKLGLSGRELVEMGWTLDLLKAIGLHATNMIDFGLPLREWVEHFKVSDFAALGFDTYANCATAGWSHGDIEQALQTRRPTTAVRNGGLRFI